MVCEFSVAATMKILVITHSYAPNIDPRALRWTALCEEFVRLGHEVDVVAAHRAGTETEEVRHGVRIHRVGGGWIERLRHRLGQPVAAEYRRNDSVHTRVSPAVGPIDAARLGRHIRAFMTHLWRRIYWPDASCFWIPPAVRYARRLANQRQFDTLISVSHPFSGHVVGWFLKRSEPNLTWLADSGDPFAFSKESAPNNFSLYRKLNFWIEGQVLAKTNHFSVTTEGTANLYDHSFPQAMNKVTVIPPMLQDDFLMTEQVNAPSCSDRDAIVLLFAGVFYADVRSPVPLLKLLAEIIQRSSILNDRLQLHIVGSCELIDEVIKEYPSVAGRVILRGKLSHAGAVSAMRQANCLVNVGNKTHYQLPSKVIEYMATGKPILNICSIEHDSSAAVLRDYPHHFNWIAGDSDDLREVCRFLEQSPDCVLSDSEAHRYIKDYLKPDISAKYLSLLQAGQQKREVQDGCLKSACKSL
jgi:glycosyltransferase involved in cell wall biosynthesis